MYFCGRGEDVTEPAVGAAIGGIISVGTGAPSGLAGGGKDVVVCNLLPLPERVSRSCRLYVL